MEPDSLTFARENTAKNQDCHRIWVREIL